MRWLNNENKTGPITDWLEVMKQKNVPGANLSENAWSWIISKKNWRLSLQKVVSSGKINEFNGRLYNETEKQNAVYVGCNKRCGKGSVIKLFITDLLKKIVSENNCKTSIN